MKNPVGFLTGLIVEKEFEAALLNQGYIDIAKPQFDRGTDYVVLSKTGWVGIQVKKSTRRGDGKADKLKIENAGGLKHHKRAGSNVFAVQWGQQWYIIPFDALIQTQHNYSLNQFSQYKNAWHRVIGEPPENEQAGWLAPTAPQEQMELSLDLS